MSEIWATCSTEKKPCVQWVEKYFKDCVCSSGDEISFALGLASLIFWGVAEIPQIITNFQTKSGHGVSLGFLFTWIVGDIFNLAGCLLEPATLPTQFYSALMYTAITVILVLQTLYYDYVLGQWKCRGCFDELKRQVEGDEDSLKPKQTDPYLPIPITPLVATPPRNDLHYRSTRTFASRGTPPFGSYLTARARSVPPDVTLLQESLSSSEDESYPNHQNLLPTRPKRIISRSVGYGTFIACSANLPFRSKALREGHLILSAGRKLLQENKGTQKSNTLGLCLGWIMAAIYMGGRLPQIFLNIKRGNVEGLNPLMFMFALFANATYVGSILVRSVEWERINANAPWLLDAIVCVLLDLFIILQFAYYDFMHRRRTSTQLEDNCGDYMEVQKALTS